MRPAHAAIDLSQRSSEEYEKVQYPPSDWQQQQQTLPLHQMSDEKARRRVGHVLRPSDPNDHYYSSAAPLNPDQYEMEGKDVYEKSRSMMLNAPGRFRKAPPPRPTSFSELIEQNWEHIPPAVYTLLSCWTRFYRIGHSGIVVWDEAHFGKFGSHYLKRDFYFDVHPPLGKMLVGLVGLLSGYNGQFEFKSGEEYGDKVPYIAMRVMLATFGVALVPLGWYTAIELGLSQYAAHMVALMILFDAALLCISRFILLDSMLLFFTFTTVFFMTKFHNQRFDNFGIDWWMWLILTGISIGCVCSVKWVGLFVTLLVGCYTIEDLWNKFGDLRLSFRDQIKHWVARIGCLIVLPAFVYLLSFKIHFLILNHSGPGDSQMSSLFQANLEGNDFASNPLEVAIGSRVTFKNMGWGGGLLHSHVQTYPIGSNQQQVTCYHYKDENNEWVILPIWGEEYDAEAPLRFVKHGDIVRLRHAPTLRNLHSHNVPAPVTNLAYEVSGYGNDTIGDAHDHWRVEIVDDTSQRKVKKDEMNVHSLTTRLRFKHELLGCYLRAANGILPQWGFKQIEVHCDKENNPGDKYTYWNVESHWNDRLPSGDAKFYRSPFLRDFWHLNVAMATSNNALIPDPDKEDLLASKPLDWPFLHLGLRMCGWGDNQTKYYLLGTPIVWWGGTVSLGVSLLIVGIYLLRQQRKYIDMNADEWEHMLYAGKVAFVGWALHYLPFMIMGRVTYIHHYLPTVYFSILMFGHVLDHLLFSARRLSAQVKAISFVVAGLAVFLNFWWFRGIAFGIDGPIADYWGIQWRESWNIYNL